MGDFVLIYRIFVVYRKNYKIVGPFLVLWLVDTACACRALQLEATGAHPEKYGWWYIAFWSLSVIHHTIITREYSKIQLPFFACLTWICSVILLYRLWRVDRSLPGISPLASESETPLSRIMRSIAESGMLYTVTVASVLVCHASESYYFLIVANAVVRDSELWLPLYCAPR